MQKDWIVPAINSVKLNPTGHYPTEYIDVAGYIAAVYAYSEERFESLYQDFPKCVEKFKMMKAILAKFDAEMNK